MSTRKVLIGVGVAAGVIVAAVAIGRARQRWLDSLPYSDPRNPRTPDGTTEAAYRDAYGAQ